MKFEEVMTYSAWVAKYKPSGAGDVCCEYCNDVIPPLDGYGAETKIHIIGALSEHGVLHVVSEYHVCEQCAIEEANERRKNGEDEFLSLI
jgi:hypothetical protein